MCEQCVAETETYGEVLPGWFLVRATKNGMEMLTGQWGLIRVDDPEYIWTTTPRPLIDGCEKFEENTPAYNEALDKWYNWKSEAQDFGKYFQIDACMGWFLVEEARRMGYEPIDMPFYEWFYNYLGEWIQAHEPVSYSGKRRDRKLWSK